MSSPKRHSISVLKNVELGPPVWPKAPSVDFLKHFVRENKRNKTKKD